MGPALTNLKDLLKMPYGCGEQNMASFAPNIFVLQYFYNTNMDVSRVLDDALRYMRVGRYFGAQISYILVILLITLNYYKLFLFIDALLTLRHESDLRKGEKLSYFLQYYFC